MLVEVRALYGNAFLHCPLNCVNDFCGVFSSCVYFVVQHSLYAFSYSAQNILAIDLFKILWKTLKPTEVHTSQKYKHNYFPFSLQQTKACILNAYFAIDIE